MYDNQRPLRAAAKAAAEAQGYSAEVVRGSGGARLDLEKDGKKYFALVRTSSDRYLGWMRTEEEEWRGMKDADLIIAAALNAQRPGTADVYGLSPQDVEQAFDANLKSRDARAEGRLSKSAPIFVCLDTVPPHKAWAAGGNLKTLAKWSTTVKLGTDTPETSEVVVRATRQLLGTPTPSLTMAERDPASARESFIARVKEEFATLVGVKPEQVSVEFRVSY